jgi:hypothetical protein
MTSISQDDFFDSRDLDAPENLLRFLLTRTVIVTSTHINIIGDYYGV